MLPTEPPTAAPRSSKPSKPPKSAAPSGSNLPNLVITKFVASDDRIATGSPTSARVTIKNVGTADADGFDLGVSFSENTGLSAGAYSPTAVDGLAAGESVQVTVNLSLSDPGDYTFTAQADANDDIVESNEDDNTKTLVTSAVTLSNLRFGGVDGFYITLDPYTDSRYTLNMVIANDGPGDINTGFKIGFTYYYGAAGSGTLDPFQVTREQLPIIPAHGESYNALSGVTLPSGDVIVYAFLDAENVIDESNEEDNDARYDITVP